MRFSRHHHPSIGGLAVAACLCACSSEEGEAPLEQPMSAPTPSAIEPAPAPVDSEARNDLNPRLLRRFSPIVAEIATESNPLTLEKIELGRMLYFDKRLSKNEDLSCNSCHQLDAYGVDGQVTSEGDGGRRGSRNSPTVYHAAGAFTQFWDGRAPDVEEQAKGPILNPAEMAMPNAAAVEARLKSIPGYGPIFAKAFPGEANPITYDNVGRAIGSFERKLVTPSRWDAYLSGQKSALSAAEVEGLKVFTNVGCMVCHTGQLLGGTSYQRTGAVEPWPNQGDPGRSQVTGNPADQMMFKVPTLRNVAKTGPYFHDGSAATLEGAVARMGRHQLGIELQQQEIGAIVAWLGSLTGELPKGYIAQPALPPSPEGQGPWTR